MSTHQEGAGSERTGPREPMVANRLDVGDLDRLVEADGCGSEPPVEVLELVDTPVPVPEPGSKIEDRRTPRLRRPPGRHRGHAGRRR